MNLNSLKWRNKSLSGIEIAGAGIGVVLTLVFLFGVQQPISRNQGQRLDALKSSDSERQRLIAVQNSVQSLRKEVDRMQRRVSEGPIQLLAADSLNTRLANVALLCSECNLTSSEMQPGEGFRSARFLVVPIHLAGHGNYCDCARFIHVLHQKYADVSLYSFKLIGTPEPKAARGTFEFELRWLAEPAGPASDPEPKMTADLR